MSPLVVLTIVLVAVSATPNEANQEAIKNSVSKVGELNPVNLFFPPKQTFYMVSPRPVS